jgi:uncharacterized phage-like protein YoqJ
VIECYCKIFEEGRVVVCAFTGHRKIAPEHREKLTSVLQNAIAHAYDLGCREFVAGGALGFDTEAAREVIRFRLTHPDVSLILFLPCIEQDASWSDRQRSLYNYTLNCANEVRYISESYDPDCMRRRNYAMAEGCDIMIAYVNSPRSGSAQTVRRARELGREIYNLYPIIDS